MSLKVVGIGPGDELDMTRRAQRALESCESVVCYSGYEDLLPDVDARVLTSGMGGEVERVEKAVERASRESVCLVCSGDPNVYALAGLALEVMKSRGVEPPEIGFEVVPGIPAANSSAALLGAPLICDYFTVSLSDRLVTWKDIEERLRAVAPLDIPIVIYNPWSKGRRDNYRRTCRLVAEERNPDTPCGVVQNAGREDEIRRTLTLAQLPSLDGDPILSMTSTVIIGGEDTFEWGGMLVTPRGYGEKYSY